MYERMQKAGFRPDVITYSTLVSACTRGNDLTRALSISREMDLMGVKANQVGKYLFLRRPLGASRGIFFHLHNVLSVLILVDLSLPYHIELVLKIRFTFLGTPFELIVWQTSVR